RPEHFDDKFQKPPEACTCYYFDDNDFERYPEIDAAMLCTLEGGQLFVNHFSPNRERFRESRLYEVVNGRGAIVDAEVLTRKGQALMIGTDFGGPRGGGAQQAYLRDKCGVLVSIGIEKHFHGIGVASVSTVQQHPAAAPDNAVKGRR